MKTLKISLSASMLLLGAVLLMFFSCEKDNITTNDTEEVAVESFNNPQNSSTFTSDYVGNNTSLGEDASIDGDDLVYLEIPEEYQADPDQEVVLIAHEGSFLTDEGEEIQASLVIETTPEGNTFFSIAVSQSLLDHGYINQDFGSSERKWKDYYQECFNSRCRGIPQSQLQSCHKYCSLYATGGVIGDAGGRLWAWIQTW